MCKTNDRDLRQLFSNNQDWARQITDRDPTFFSKLSKQQAPEYLWIGCADSRVPANEIVGLLPGELFVHRNVANVVTHTDFNCHAVIQYAVEVLKVRHIMVVGHYGCGGVRAAMELDDQSHGLIDNWLRNIKDVYDKHQEQFNDAMTVEQRADRLCELNVREQLINVCNTTTVRDAWRRGQELHVHGWIYGLKDGELKDLGLCVSGPEEVPSYAQSVLV